MNGDVLSEEEEDVDITTSRDECMIQDERIREYTLARWKSYTFVYVSMVNVTNINTERVVTNLFI